MCHKSLSPPSPSTSPLAPPYLLPCPLHTGGIDVDVPNVRSHVNKSDKICTLRVQKGSIIERPERCVDNAQVGAVCGARIRCRRIGNVGYYVVLNAGPIIATLTLEKPVLRRGTEYHGAGSMAKYVGNDRTILRFSKLKLSVSILR